MVSMNQKALLEFISRANYWWSFCVSFFSQKLHASTFYGKKSCLWYMCWQNFEGEWEIVRFTPLVSFLRNLFISHVYFSSRIWCSAVLLAWRKLWNIWCDYTGEIFVLLRYYQIQLQSTLGNETLDKINGNDLLTAMAFVRLKKMRKVNHWLWIIHFFLYVS